MLRRRSHITTILQRSPHSTEVPSGGISCLSRKIGAQIGESRVTPFEAGKNLWNSWLNLPLRHGQ